MRLLHFEIKSFETSGENRDSLKRKVEKAIDRLNNLEGVEVVNEEALRRGDVMEYDGGELFGTTWKSEFLVKKTGRKTTWNDVYRTVNGVYTSHYRFIAA